MKYNFVKELLTRLKDAQDIENAKRMQAYMKTEQFFYGVNSPKRRQIFKEVKKNFKIQTQEEYQKIILELWEGKSREEMYFALDVAESNKKFITLEAFPFFEKLVFTATNWDTLDWICSKLISPLILKNRNLEKTLEVWSESKNFWVRRASILAHLKHREETNTEFLSKIILKLAHEKEFFIRKAIGWVLREYSYSDSNWVIEFVKTHEEILSGLSKREALKRIKS
ncbi:MAG: DNA alkylation repair protein [Calditrichaeota bacterium]|nr:MAG: DNA alkylation repair protein [Calditrichota bacterium]